jgi:chloride channel 7
MDMDGNGNSPRPPPRRPEREGSYNNYDIESMDGGSGAAPPPWRQHNNGSSEALLRYDDGGADRGSEARQPLLRKRTMNTTSQIAIVGANVCPIESLDYE